VRKNEFIGSAFLNMMRLTHKFTSPLSLNGLHTGLHEIAKIWTLGEGFPGGTGVESIPEIQHFRSLIMPNLVVLGRTVSTWTAWFAKFLGNVSPSTCVGFDP